jgi:hypothetical protein
MSSSTLLLELGVHLATRASDVCIRYRHGLSGDYVAPQSAATDKHVTKAANARDPEAQQAANFIANGICQR